MATKVKRHVSVSMTVWLLAVWIAVFASVKPAVVVGGLIVAVAVQLIFPLPVNKSLWRVRIGPFLYLVVRFNWDLIVAGLNVSWLVISGKKHEDGIVKCEVRSDNPVYMTIVAAMTSMIPGTIVVEASRSEHALYLHVLDLEVQGGIEGVREAVLAQEKRVLFALAPRQVLMKTGLWKGLGR